MRDLTHDIATKRIANIHFFSQLSIPNFFVSYRNNKKRSETRQLRFYKNSLNIYLL